MKITHDNWGHFFSACPTVLLDGVQQQMCIEADDSEGYVIVYDADEQGAPRISGEAFVTKRIEGKVALIGPLQCWVN